MSGRKVETHLLLRLMSGAKNHLSSGNTTPVLGKGEDNAFLMTDIASEFLSAVNDTNGGSL